MYELASLLVYPGGPSTEPIAATIPISTEISSPLPRRDGPRACSIMTLQNNNSIRSLPPFVNKFSVNFVTYCLVKVHLHWAKSEFFPESPLSYSLHFPVNINWMLCKLMCEAMSLSHQYKRNLKNIKSDHHHQDHVHQFFLGFLFSIICLVNFSTLYLPFS